MRDFRPHTYDQRIFNKVFHHNEYLLPDSFHPEDIVIDIGAHIGSFALACLFRGCGHVECYEANNENYSILVRNMRGYGKRRYTLHNEAVWKPDETIEHLRLSKYRNNTGAGTLVCDDGVEPVKGIEIGGVLVRALARAEKIRLLKLDCEGAEFPILYYLKHDPLGERWLSKVEEIIGEVHDMTEEYGRPIGDHAKVEGFDDYTHKGLKSFLESVGYKVILWQATSDGLHLFRAWRER